MKIVCSGVLLLALAGSLRSAEPSPSVVEPVGAFDSLEGEFSLPVNTVTGVSRYSQKSTDAPSSVTVVTAEEIESQGWISMAEVFRAVRGFEVTSDRTYSYLGVRGFSRLGDFNSRLLFMVDGQRLNDTIYSGFQLDSGFGVDLGEVKRIEILRGPASSQYGNNAFFGVINIVPMTGADWAGNGSQGGAVTASAGDNGSTAGRAIAGGLIGKDAEYTVSVSTRHKEGERGITYPDTPAFAGFKSSPGGDAEDTRTARTSVTWKNTSFTAGWSERTKTIPTAPFGTAFGDTRTQGVDEIGWARLSQSAELSSDLRGEAAISYFFYEYDGTYIFDENNLPVTVPPGLYRVKDEAYAGAYQAELSLIRDFGGGTLSLGADARLQPEERQRNYISAPRTDFMRISSDSLTAGAFTQLDWTFSSALSASAGVRFDHDDNIGSGVHPRGTLIWHPTKPDTVKLIAGTAFRAPTPYELHYDNGGLSQKAPASLDAEKITSYELLWEHYFTSRVKTTTTVFWNELDGLISPMIDPGDGLAVFTNMDTVRVHGVEGEVEWLFAQGASLVASVAAQQVEQTGMDASSAELLAKLAARTPLPGVPLWAGLELQHSGERLARDGSKVGSFWLTNASVGTREYRGLSARLTVRNVFDVNYSDPVGDDFAQVSIIQPRRSWDLSVNWRF
jgi:outer membrane receptor for ferrienterochelin and colicins